jgi:hypothetical protein
MLKMISLITIIMATSPILRGHISYADSAVTNREFKFSAKFPNDTKICRSYSGQHLQGYFVYLDHKRSCGDSNATGVNERFLSIVASYNTEFFPGMVDVTPDTCRILSKSQQRRNGLDIVRIGHDNTVTCLEESSSIIKVVAAVRFGKWSDYFSTGPERRAKRVNLLVTLGTDRSHLKRDLDTFKQFISNIHINQ